MLSGKRNLLRMEEDADEDLCPDDVVVTIPEEVVHRMHALLVGSDVEEGGKFVGEVIRNPNGLHFSVESYIDSGPLVSKSSVHLVPDGDYQAKAFRLVEHVSPTLEHLGSWHSHHTNGLRHLSAGDQSGYLSTVDDERFNLDVFFALLITEVGPSRLRGQAYVARRGEGRLWALPASAIRVVPGASQIEMILAAAEKVVICNRSDETQERRYGGVEDFLRPFLARDRVWIVREFPHARATLNRATGAIAWTWNGPRGYTVRLAYPVQGQGQMRLSVTSGNAVALDQHIPNDAALERTVSDALALLEA